MRSARAAGVYSEVVDSVVSGAVGDAGMEKPTTGEVGRLFFVGERRSDAHDFFGCGGGVEGGCGGGVELSCGKGRVGCEGLGDAEAVEEAGASSMG